MSNGSSIIDSCDPDFKLEDQIDTVTDAQWFLLIFVLIVYSFRLLDRLMGTTLLWKTKPGMHCTKRIVVLITLIEKLACLIFFFDSENYGPWVFFSRHYRIRWRKVYYAHTLDCVDSKSVL